MKIEIKSRFSGNVLFSFERKNNSIRITLEAALKAKVNLYGANLYGADLRDANLYGADLRGAYLYGADLRDADLRGAYLYGADDKKIKCDGRFHHVINIGSECGILELYSCGADGWIVKRGCFTGSKDEFLAAVNKRHGENEHGKKYRAIIAALCE